MGNREPLNAREKEQIFQKKLRGETLAKIAEEMGCSHECARKWWRIGRKQGIEGLRSGRKRRQDCGSLVRFAGQVRAKALELKETHPGWGANRVRIELRADPALSGLAIPGRSSLAAYFKKTCPQRVAQHKPRQAQGPPTQASVAHEVWQVDNQEKIELEDGQMATICNIRDPVGAAMIASQAFVVTGAKHWRKLQWTEVRSVLRQGFCEWQTLPERVLTDNELCLAGTAIDPFPGHLTCWLVGLGIQHEFIRPHRPTDQPHIERNHRTLDGLALYPQALATPQTLQHSLDHERSVYNHQFPCQASDCHGLPPLAAHPELLKPPRPYHPKLELALFDRQRVLDFLAGFTFKRKTLASGCISLGRHLYVLGKKLIREMHLVTVQARLDPKTAEWVISTDGPNPKVLARRPIKGMDTAFLTGLLPSQPSSGGTISLDC
jgi:transposase-like protein